MCCRACLHEEFVTPDSTTSRTLHASIYASRSGTSLPSAWLVFHVATTRLHRWARRKPNSDWLDNGISLSGRTGISAIGGLVFGYHWATSNDDHGHSDSHPRDDPPGIRQRHRCTRVHSALSGGYWGWRIVHWLLCMGFRFYSPTATYGGAGSLRCIRPRSHRIERFGTSPRDSHRRAQPPLPCAQHLGRPIYPSTHVSPRNDEYTSRH